eukprot:SAG31_NODE_2083_length_6490_cov_21.969645_5_plen_131_part_00
MVNTFTPSINAAGTEALLPLAAQHPQANSKNQLNTINGCYVPCLLNILGAVLYLRMGFAVGQMGMLGALAIISISEAIAYLTVSSFSAIVTNGKMRGGGAYYMISRNLGCETSPPQPSASLRPHPLRRAR